MRSARFGLLHYLLLFAAPAWAQQAQTATTPSPAPTDPQAVAVVQAAITALGGPAAIGKAQSWTFQAQMQGSHANGKVEYVMSTDTDTGKRIHPDGTMKAAPPIHSHFVPALVGVILLKQSQDPTLIIQYGGTTTLDSKPVTVINFVFTVGNIRIPAQIWTFDAANLPVLIDFKSSAEVGARQSYPAVVSLSDYRAVSGVLYPFRISTFLPGRPPQNIAVESMDADVAVPVNEFNGPGGDLQ